ncbi:MAG: hypothetical protein GY810_01215 [Aureispira sp.]|nr:hypothetical protein [Aureispira sp.]
MLRDYYNKMLGKGRYSIKMNLIPPVFQEELRVLLHMKKYNDWDARTEKLLADMRNLHKDLRSALQQKDQRDELGKFIEYAKKEIANKR